MSSGWFGVLVPQLWKEFWKWWDWFRTGWCHVARLIADILHLPHDEMHSHFAQAGVHFEVVQWVMMPWWDNSMFEDGEMEGWPHIKETELDIHEVIMLFERHMWYLQEFSPITWKALIGNLQFQRYWEHLRVLSAHFPTWLQDKVQKFFSRQITPQTSLLRSLERSWLLPEQVNTFLNETGNDYRFWGVPIQLVIAYSGINSFKKMFELKLTTWANLLGSYEAENTEARILTFLRVELLSALDFLTTYFDAEQIRTFIKNEYGDNILRSLFEGVMWIRQRYMEMLGSDEIATTFAREWIHFYRDYNSLVQRLFDLEIIPQRIIWEWTKELSKSL
jgi:hypothetical protein